MRILFLVHRIPYPPNKGDKIRSFGELRTLAEENEVDVFCFYDDPKDAVCIEELRRYCNSCYAEWMSPWLARARALTAFWRGLPFTVAYYSSASMRRRVGDALASKKYDCILVFSSSMAQYTAANVPTVVDLVDVDSDKWIQYANHHSVLTRWLWRREGRLLAEHEREITEKADSVLLCTQLETEILRSIAPDACNVFSVPNATDLQYWNPSGVNVGDDLKARSPYVVFPGQMDYYPNVEAAVRFHEQALPLLRREVPEVTFVVAGRNPTRAVRRLSADPGVWVTGTVSDMRPLLAGAAAAVIPLRIARGVQNKVLECLAMGIPVVSSSKAAAALPSAVAELLIIADDPTETASHLAQIIKSRRGVKVERVRGIVDEYFGFNALKRSIGERLREAAGRNRVMQTVEAR